MSEIDENENISLNTSHADRVLGSFNAEENSVKNAREKIVQEKIRNRITQNEFTVKQKSVKKKRRKIK